MKQDNLSDKMIKAKNDDFSESGLFLLKDVKEFIKLIQTKVLTDWKGQNEFIDWLKTKSGEDLK